MIITANDEAWKWGYVEAPDLHVGMWLQMVSGEDGAVLGVREIEAIDRCGPEGWCKLHMGPKREDP